VARARRLAKLRSRTCRSDAMIKGSIMATTISAQSEASCAGVPNATARLNEANKGNARSELAEQRAGITKLLPCRSSKNQAIKLIDPSTTSHVSGHCAERPSAYALSCLGGIC